MKTILVTGASGVLAKRFISKNAAFYNIILGVRNPANDNEVQVDSWDEISTSVSIDAVVHLAGKYLVEDSLVASRNVIDAVVGTATAVVNLCKKDRIPIVALGSYFEKAPKDMQPWSHYSIAKKSAAKILELASLDYGIPIDYIYTYDTYGVDLARRKIVDVLLDSSTRQLELSPGEQKLNLTHEDDFVEAIRLSLENVMVKAEKFENFQVRNPRDEMSLQEIAQMINSFRREKIELKFGSKPYRRREVFEIWDCAPNIEGWLPKVGFKDFVARIVGDSVEF